MQQHEPRALAHSVSTACQLVGLGRTKFYELLAAGEIPTIRIGSRRLIRDADLVGFLDRLARQGAAA